MSHVRPFVYYVMHLSKSLANGTKLSDADLHKNVLLAAMLDADKIVPLLDEALISASKVFYVPAIIIRNQIYASIYVTEQLLFWDTVLPVLDAA